MTASVQRLLLLCAALSSFQWAAEAAIGDLLWSDEFNDGAATTVNTTVWNVRTGAGGWGNFELQEYTADSVRIVDGNALEIRVARTSSYGAAFTSGRIDTAQTVEFLYGRIEARIKTPNVVEGLWPAFWTLGSSYSKGVKWPDCGEVDVMEVGQGLALAAGLGNRRIVSAAHWVFNKTYATTAGSKDVDFNLNEQYNVYVLNWTPQSLITYVNGAEIWRMNIDRATCVDCEEFHQPHFIVLNVAVGGGFTSSGSNSSNGCGSSSSSSGGTTNCGPVRTAENITASLPAAMLVDWVRIFDNGNTGVTYSSGSSVSTRPPVAAAAAALPTPAPTQNDGLMPPPPPVPLFKVPTTSPTRYTLAPTLPQADPLLPPPQPTGYYAPPAFTPSPPPSRKPVTKAVATPSGNVEKAPYPVTSDTVHDDDDDDDAQDYDSDECDGGKGKSGKEKSSKGDSGKSGKDERRRHLKKSDKKSCGKKKKGMNKNGEEYENGLAISAATASHPSPMSSVVTAPWLAAASTALLLLLSWRS